jgi:hypothetical protein
MGGKVTTVRPREWPEPQTMLPRRYPKIVGAATRVEFFWQWEVIPPGGTGVPPTVKITGPLHALPMRYHPAAVIVGYHRRRQRRWPKLGGLPVLPYLGPKPPGPYWKDREPNA